MSSGIAAPVKPLKVVVCVISYRRPAGLTRLLEALDRQCFGRSPAADFGVLVIDNDPEGSAGSTCDAARTRLLAQIDYRHEPRRGIPYARNAAVRQVGDSADFIAFVDDDEVPAPTWLDELLVVQARYDADVVSGPVIPHFEDPPPAWILRGGFFQRERRATGSAMTVAHTNNVLVRTAVFRGMDRVFDESLALTGGSDTHFFLRVWRAGFKLVWADEALIREWVPGSRLTVPYVLRRGYRTGNTRGICERAFGRADGQWSVGVARAAWWIVKGTCLLPVSLLMGTHATLRAMRVVCTGAGYFAGRFGLRFEEYRTTDGS